MLVYYMHLPSDKVYVVLLTPMLRRCPVTLPLWSLYPFACSSTPVQPQLPLRP